jgi:hypothetical protein
MSNYFMFSREVFFTRFRESGAATNTVANSIRQLICKNKK